MRCLGITVRARHRWSYGTSAQVALPALQVVFSRTAGLPRVSGTKITGVPADQSVGVNCAGVPLTQALGANTLLLRLSEMSADAVCMKALASCRQAALAERCM